LKKQRDPQEPSESLLFLKNERFNCIDDLPTKRVTLDDADYYKYKCRTGWWQGIISRFRYLLYRNLITDDQVKQEMHAFLDYTSKIDFTKFRTREEIDQANSAIDKVITCLKRAHSEAPTR
jgi:hypothetical protein